MIWQDCDGARWITPIRGLLHRLVESQEHIATLGYVDTLEEQAVLEAMLEDSKPPSRESDAGYHYLLRTPFRYPPLPWGSRFGHRHEPGILYGSLDVRTTLAESAYYRLIFWHSMHATPPKDMIHSQHTLFSVGYKTAYGVRLHQPPFDRLRTHLTDPQDYTHTQALGSAMREADVEAFEYSSARHPEHGLCVGLFRARALAQRQPQYPQPWLCETRADEVSFKQLGSPAVVSYAIEDFLVQGQLPRPAQ